MEEVSSGEVGCVELYGSQEGQHFAFRVSHFAFHAFNLWA